MLPGGYPAFHSPYPCCLVSDFLKSYPQAPPNSQRTAPSFSIDSILSRDSSSVTGRLPTSSGVTPTGPAGPSTLWAATTTPLHYHYAGAELCGE
ncbi:hypothetical protein AVEN_165993-1 [Araneus ventricosus]|uniref:Uncharacterized protein n=1 Tax=Araneus ventricosus TaxID=182803 RepID=A0A4Y2NCZ2_ARAVE|nr:hypothetical protein AVEN_239328-1 [Araneus ventricosus]GBN36840.1 hypothetical protein AVEN_216804-1 [Araneus ventricosus]GBN37270.1 hypothetical protein AVEN_124418-1 [Araneus ventricosus]GBN37288.1 hypothetical protein AVEN_165993-1 [Araneus ventricosus]